jgi:5-hydroxyisourate hydrolase
MISTHILDTSQGRPAASVRVTLEKQNKNAWEVLATELTNADGRIQFQIPASAGIYRLVFATEAYFQAQKLPSFFSDIPVHFNISDTQRKYHVPLLLNPFGYSTYRGS